MTVIQNPTSLRRLLMAPLMAGALLVAAGCADDETDQDNGVEEVDTGAAEESETDDDTTNQDSSGEEIAFTEVENNDSPDSCWAAIDQTVYDLTDWIDQHPGGADRIEPLCGTDATEQFTQQHGGSEGPEEQLTEFEIGALED